MRVNAEPLHTYAHARIHNAGTVRVKLMVGVASGPGILPPKVGNYVTARKNTFFTATYVTYQLSLSHFKHGLHMDKYHSNPCIQGSYYHIL